MRSFWDQGFPRKPELRGWLKEQTRLPRERHHIWMIHPALFADHIDEPDWNPHTHRVEWYFVLDTQNGDLLLEVFRATGATHIITAHIHCRRVSASG